MNSISFSGLTHAEAARSLQDAGPNELPRARKRGLVQIALETMREPMFLLLLGAAVLYMVLGDFGEGLFLFAGALGTIGLVIFQEARSERALAALRELSQPQVRVIREGLQLRIPARELAPGDLMLIGEGDRVAADGLLVAGEVLRVDESVLTGESAPVLKPVAADVDAFATDPEPGAEPGAASGPCLYSGTLNVGGQGLVRVTRTGPHSALGRIGATLAQISQQKTPLQKSAGRLVTLLGLLALVFCGVIVLAYGFLRADWVGGALAGITVAIALIPEEFPMVLAVFLALGAWRLASHRVLVRRSAVIEALGGATVLCVDKTGTLTENRMRIARIWTEAEDLAISDQRPPAGACRTVLEFAALASAGHPVDPMDKAIRELLPQESQFVPAGARLERAWPLRPAMMAVVQVWRDPDDQRIAGAKGSPEAIFRLCRLPQEQVSRLTEVLLALATEGLRILGVASCRSDMQLPETPESVRFDFSGFIGFLDPLRTDAPAAIEEARAAGLKVIMITGDHPATALAIARSAGLDVRAGVVMGSDIMRHSPAALQAVLRDARVFARVTPEQKLRIVEALKANNEVVAMTGDGVNDAPALEAAHIGIAMGRRGVDVAREAADLVLLDDSFASIVGGVRMGRRIFTNLRRALTYVTAIHVPIAGLALLPILFGMPPMLFPMHVVLLELAIDPICALVFEGEPSERTAMRRPPRSPQEALFGMRQLLKALGQGVGVLAGVFGFYAILLQHFPEPVARGGAFMTLVLANLVLALADAMSTDGSLFAPHRRMFWSIAGVLVAVLATVVSVPALASIFRIAVPGLPVLLAAILIALVSGGWLRVAETALAAMRNPRASGANASREAHRD